MEQPWTPDPKANIPNKRWGGMLKTWRSDLHKWDPEGAAPPSSRSCPEAEALIAGLGKWGGDEEVTEAVSRGLLPAPAPPASASSLAAPPPPSSLDPGAGAGSDGEDVYERLAEGEGVEEDEEDSDDDLL